MPTPQHDIFTYDNTYSGKNYYKWLLRSSIGGEYIYLAHVEIKSNWTRLISTNNMYLQTHNNWLEISDKKVNNNEKISTHNATFDLKQFVPMNISLGAMG